MSQRKKPSETRHGKLADTTAQTSITMNKELLAKARAAAKAEGRSLSNWLEQVVKKAIPFSLIAFLAWHASRSARDWSPAALVESAKTAIALIQ